MKKTIMLVFGTRPEAIKMAPIVKFLKQDKRFVCKVCVTGQHRQMLDTVLSLFDIVPDYDLDIMKSNQTLSTVTSSILQGLENIFSKNKPDIVLVHGDTATTMATTLSSYFHQIPVAHVEAGLRTGNLYSPWPEEGNRKVTGAIANIHFAPTQYAKSNLLKENISESTITITGNTVIDALFLVSDIINKDSDMVASMHNIFPFLSDRKKMVLVTGHRRENFGSGFENICFAIKKVANEYPEMQFVYPVHLNPQVQKPVNELLSNVDNIFLIEPQDYLPFVYLMGRSYFILTDSGGIQEEAPSLGKPVLVMRDTTERPEAVDAGTVKLVGTEIESIYSNMKMLIEDQSVYSSMALAHIPYGDGNASLNIIRVLANYFNLVK